MAKFRIRDKPAKFSGFQYGANSLSLGGVIKSRATREQNPFIKLLSGIAAGQQFAAGAIGEMVRRNKGYSSRSSVWQAGLSGMEREASFREVTHNPVTGLILDWIIDPINIVAGAGVGTKMIKGSGSLMKLIGKTPGIKDVVAAVGPKISANYALRQAGFDAWVGHKARYLGSLNAVKHRELDPQIKKFVELVPDKARREKIWRLAHDQAPGRPMELNYEVFQREFASLSKAEQEAFAIAGTFTQKIEDIRLGSGLLELERAEGLLVKRDATRYVAKYVKQDVTKENSLMAIDDGLKRLEDASVSPKKIEEVQKHMAMFTDQLAKIKKMDTLVVGNKYKGRPMPPVEEMPSFLYTQKDPRKTFQLGKQLELVEQDMAKVMKQMDVDTAKALAFRDYIGGAQEQLLKDGMIIPKALRGRDPASTIKQMRAAGYEVDPALFTHRLRSTRVKGFEDYLIPEPLVKELEAAATAYRDPEEAIHIWHKLTNMWKGWTLGIFPSFHSRNALSNVWNNYLAGMGLRSIHHYKNALPLTHKFQTGVFDGRKVVAGLTDKELFETAVQNRVWDAGQFSEVYEVFADANAGRIRGFFDPRPGKNHFTRAGYKTGRFVENHARLSHFMWRLGKGDTVEDAARSVQKYLFDYQYGLTSWEKGVFRDRLMPFWAWTRFNIPLQLEMIVRQPQKFAGFEKARRTLEDQWGGPEPNEMLLPEWLKKSMSIRIKQNKDGTYEYFSMDAWWPSADIAKLFSARGIAQSFVNLWTPFMKIPFEMAFNYNMFQGRKIERFAGEKRKVVGWDLPSRMEHMARSVRLVNEIDRVMKAHSVGGVGSMALRIFAGRTYPVDFEKQKRSWDWLTREQLKELKGMRNSARKRHDYNDIDALERAIRDVEQFRRSHLGIYK